MKKYIRTKDGRVISFNTYRDDVDLIAYLSQFANYQDEYAPIKQADTIEELCDEFVAVSKDNKYRSLVKIEETGNRWVEDKITQWCEVLENKFANWNIYGAIWTDKGLIYVARMNDKGELELL